MNEFLDCFKKIIREANYDNTYKMAWAKAIVELSNDYDSDGLVAVSLQEIAGKVLKYYWNQTIFFNLIQGSNILKRPVILQKTEILIEQYYKVKKDRKPEFYERAEAEFFRFGIYSFFLKIKNEVVITLKADVSYRFLILDGISHKEIYQYEKGDDQLFIQGTNLDILKKNQQDLYDLINYRWSLILETFNSSPRINKKVRIMDERKIKRTPLNKYRKYLDIENPNRKCFICGEEIKDEDLTIDHVIPWSYLYSDDIWNLVYVHKGCNSRKSNISPSEEFVQKLKERNSRLLCNLHKGNTFEELKLAIDQDFVTKFWIGSRN